MGVDLPRWRFEQLVAAALDDLPADLAAAIDNVTVQVADRDTDDPDLLGLYEGIPLTERQDYSMVAPDVITLFRRAICAICATEADVVREVRVTVIHEVAHHFGIDDDRLDDLGWS